EVNDRWRYALQNMGGYRSAYGAGPDRFRLNGKVAQIGVGADETQRVIDYFKEWLPRVAGVYDMNLKREIQEQEEKRRNAIKAEQARLDEHLKVNQALRF